MEAEDLYLSIVNNLCDGVYYVNSERKIMFWNKAAEDITGYSAAEIIGKTCQDSKLNHIDAKGRPLCTIGCPLYATIIDSKQRSENVFVRHKFGYRIPLHVKIFPIEENGEIIGAIEIFTQSSPTVYDDNLVEQLSGIAMHDALTGLPNRRYLESYLEYRFTEYRRFQKPFAVLFADIDDFRHFNNKYGHETGDTVLTNISNSIKRNVRKNDLIGRWGGEEFVGIYSIVQPYDAPILAEKLRCIIQNTEVTYQRERLNITMSIGITVVRETDTEQSIVERADHLMYQSKQAGKNRIASD